MQKWRMETGPEALTFCRVDFAARIHRPVKRHTDVGGYAQRNPPYRFSPHLRYKMVVH